MKEKTSNFAKQKAYRESLDRVEKDLLQYIRDGISIRKSCYILDIPQSTVYNWLKIAENNPDAPNVLKRFWFDFQNAKVEGRKTRLAMEKLGKLKIKLDTGDVLDIEKIVGYGKIMEIERIIDLGNLSEKRQAQADLDEQEDEDAWVTKVKASFNEHGKDDNSL